MIELNDGTVISALDEAVAIFDGRGMTGYVGSTKVISVRLPTHLAIQIDALAHKSGQTRTLTISTLLEAALEQVKSRLSKDSLEVLENITSEHLDDFFAQEKPHDKASGSFQEVL